MLARRFEIKATIVGEQDELSKTMTVFNIRICWNTEGVTCEADPRHSRQICEELGLSEARGADTPCDEGFKKTTPEEDAKLDMKKRYIKASQLERTIYRKTGAISSMR